MELFPYQVDHARRILESIRSRGAALDSSDTGTGKTPVACHVAREAGWQLVVVAPKAVLPAWRAVAEAMGVRVLLISNYEAVKLAHTPVGRFVDKRFRWELPPDALLVFDEAQRCKARDSQNAELLIAARRQRVRTLMLSATAASNPLEMRAIGYSLGLFKLEDYWRWARANGCAKGRFGMEYRGGPEVLARLHSTIFDDLRAGARMRIAEIPGFPETQIIPDPVGTGRETEIQAVYDGLKEDLNHALAAGDDHELGQIANALDARGPNHLTIQLRARQSIELHKVESIVSLARDGVAEGQSVAIFVNFDETLREVASALGTQCVIRGDQGEEERAEAIRRFQSNEEPFIVCNIRAGGVGVSLHDPSGRRPRLALICPTFSAQDLRQALGRVHRAGGAHSIQRIVFAAGTVEERACAAVRAKLANIDALNDGDLLGAVGAEESPRPRRTIMNAEPQAAPTATPRPAHARHSPSALALKEICPGFDKRDEPPGPAAEEGTLLHAALESGNLDGLDEEQLQVVRMCQDYVENLENQVYGEGERTLHILREHQVSICDGATFGTLDYALFNHRLCRADLVDFKMGRNAVPDAEVNPQIQAYVLGLFEEIDSLEVITAHILLPRRDEVSVAHYSRRDVPRLRLRISTIIARCECAEPELRPTDNCLWCARQATCPALHRHALTVAAGYDGELALPDQYHPGHISDPRTMARALNVARVLKEWCESVRHHALRMRLDGAEIPGYELRSRSGARRVTDAAAAWLAVRDRIPPERFAACCEVSVPKLEDAFAEGAPRGAKTKAKQELCEALADLGIVETGEEVPYLARVRK